MKWRINTLCFEFDTELYYQALDIKVKNYTSAAAIEIFSPVSHTLFNPADIIQKNGGRPPLSYQSFVKLPGEPSWASSPVSNAPTWLPTVGSIGNYPNSEVPSIEELGYEEDERSPYKGGESEALRRLRESISNKLPPQYPRPNGGVLGSLSTDIGSVVDSSIRKAKLGSALMRLLLSPQLSKCNLQAMPEQEEWGAADWLMAVQMKTL